MNTMFSIALPFPNMVHLYVTMSMVDLTINLNAEPKYVEEYVDVDLELDAPPVCHEEEMVATNEYTEFRTETDDEFEEIDFNGCEYEVPSNTFTDLDMDTVDGIQEDDPIIVSMVTDNTKLYTGMICENKEMLQHMVKCFAIKSHAPYEVVESTPTKWVIRCKKSNEGCKWRLRAIMKKSHGLFEITKLSDQHTCFYSELSQSHVQLDSSMLAREFFESVREKPSISVVSLQDMIKEKFGYHVSYRRALDEKWTQAHDGGFWYGWMTTNLSECMNGVFKEARMYALEKILKWSARSSKHEVQSYDRSEGMFHVKTGHHELNSRGGNIQMLKLNASERYCSCNKWQAFGIPCSHFMAVCSWFNMNYEDFVEDYYKISTYVACYAPQFQPVPHENYWISPTSMLVLLPDPSLFRKSETVWDDRNMPEINCRRREAVVHHTILLHRNILPLLRASGFYGLARLGFIQLDWHLIIALLERWRPEMHTFHMSVGECTITLQDVKVLVGLLADGEPVTDQMHDVWLHICQKLLGVIPPLEQIRGQRLILTWLGAEFHELANDADEETITRYARAYILQLMGGSIFADKSTRYIVWEPYKTVIDSLPHFCTNGHDIWRTISPLICFYIGEWHHPDRVLRQFSIQQVVPRDCNTEPLLHNIDLRSSDWSDRVAYLVMQWHNRRRFTTTEPPIEQFDMYVTQEYIHWYKNITKLYITQLGAAMSHLNVADDPQQVLNICNDNEQYMENIHYMYDVPIVPALVQRRRPLVQEPDQLEENDQHVEEVPPVTLTLTQTDHSYVSPVMMMPTFGTTYYDSGVGQSSDFGRGYYNSEAGRSSTDFGQQYYDLGSDPSSSYMHGHGRGRGEHNEYLYYEVPAAVLEQSDEQQQQKNQEEI
ncbi:mediator of RNA polymerase II transcription subunit 12-like isoform X1 [Cucumis melo var. makuwa]|uniref:Mediator of RNA polymerase II transcription subunit 12-like isoform X1 n=1 Tax=Cucumis melo var. makuwa TaxID=1194695 RepID=A0A5A7U115_CUCMM|nr:mediator of RNA polymerase II transcription subunit 12-like isoform X1 [Cucumis melo var. makuwa]